MQVRPSGEGLPAELRLRWSSVPTTLGHAWRSVEVRPIGVMEKVLPEFQNDNNATEDPDRTS